ncbi:MAG: hypothetical protein SFV19_14585 [Rhodospirillaceae bacterium]|nr:hypothetical protein [Rhodospirillaceae bacterium]
MTRIVGIFLASLALGTWCAQATVSAQDPISELKTALDIAKSQAASSDGLDAAYEFIGIAEEANNAGNPEIATEAIAAFSSVVERAAEIAQRQSYMEGQNTLDQIVDLAFFARTNDIPAAETTLRKALGSLLPQLLANARRALAEAKEWTDKLAILGAIGELQAAAARVVLDQEASEIGIAFDAEAAIRDGEAAGDSARMQEIANLRRVRDEQLADAIANNVNAVAEEMRGDVPSSSDEGEIGEAMSADLSLGDTSCIETGMIPPGGAPDNWQAPPLLLKRLGDECVLSGRAPQAGRCTTVNLTFVCHVPGRESERITYVYRDTAEETFMRRACEGAIIEAAKLPATGPQFLNSSSRLVFTCGPVTEEIPSTP